MKLFELYRYSKPSPGPDIELVEGYPNIFHATRWPAWPGLNGAGRVQLDHGIDSVTNVKALDGVRQPAILIASKPHRAGSDWTPWHDELNPEAAGHVRYFGNNEAGRAGPSARSDWKQSRHERVPTSSLATRADRMRRGTPIFFESLVHEGRTKGFWQFIGFGVVERAQLTTQVDRQDRWFVNYVFDCALFDLSSEALCLDWDWIAARRDPTKSLGETLDLAPASWRTGSSQGERAIERVRQRVTRFQFLGQVGQRPEVGTPAETALRSVVEHYKRLETLPGRR